MPADETAPEPIETNLISVRRAVTDDLEILVEMHHRTILHMMENPPHGFFGDPAAAPDHERLLNDFQEAVDGEDAILLVAEVAGEIAGSALGIIEEFSDELIEAPYLTVLYVATADAWRRRGVAGRLLSEMEQVARERGLRILELRVWANNESAFGLYERFGYKTIEHRMAKRLVD
ncbi:GNAT family N-acetyltransferase [bacterium]|nr:GNAT family N-acetyltransferase [bacterium]